MIEIVDREYYEGLLAEKNEEIERLRRTLEEINAEVRPELCASELELIVWWGRQVDRLQSIARSARAPADGGGK